ncbi:MAG: UbiD family decarboxylase domain-containing protein, partial [Chloroflexota bacterium]
MAVALREQTLAGIRDLRDWLAAVDEMGELQRVDGADWNLEIGGLSELNYRRKPAAAMLFDHIPGYPAGFRVLTGSLASAKRIGATLRLGTDFTDQRLVEAMRGGPLEWERLAPEFAPVEVQTAPLFENVVEAPDVDLLRFPVPRWHEHDGGRYIGTGCMVLTSDPDSGIVNGGAYRMMVQQDGRSASLMPVPGKHGYQHITKWWDREGRAPVAISFGHDPLLFMVSATEVP